MRINPMIYKELMVSVRGIRTTVLMVVFNFILSAVGLIMFYQVIEDAKSYGQIDYDMIIQLYVLLIVFEALLLAFIVPAMAAGSISGERERQTLDILLSSPLSSWSIVSGKLISCVLSVALLIVSSVPSLSLIYVFGGIGFWEMFQTILLLIYLAIYAGIVGVFCSSVFKKTTSSTVASYGLLLLIGLGTPFLYFIFEMLMYSSYYYDSDYFMTVLLINPGFTMAYLLISQLTGDDMLVSGTPFLDFVADYWMVLSLVLQLIFLAFLLWLSVKRLNPLKKRRRAS